MWDLIGLIFGILLFILATCSILLSFEEPGLAREFLESLKDFFGRDAK